MVLHPELINLVGREYIPSINHSICTEIQITFNSAIADAAKHIATHATAICEYWMSNKTRILYTPSKHRRSELKVIECYLLVAIVRHVYVLSPLHDSICSLLCIFMNIPQDMPRARQAVGASAARSGHR